MTAADFVLVLCEKGTLAKARDVDVFSQLGPIAVAAWPSKLGEDSADSVPDSSPCLCRTTYNYLV